MKHKNLKYWRETGDMREEKRRMDEFVESIIQENEELKEALESYREEMRGELEDMLRMEFEERLAEMDHKLSRAVRQHEEDVEEIRRLNDVLEDRDRCEATRMAALREVLGCTVNNVTGNYIENQNNRI